LRWIFIASDFSVCRSGVNHQLSLHGGRIAFPVGANEHSVMALTTSEELADGMPVPDFSLPDVTTGDNLTPGQFADNKALVVIFLCRHCPYVVHVLPEIIRAADHYLAKGVAFLGISANDATNYPEDSPAKLAAMVSERHIPFPIAYDESQDVARAFHAVCTPEFFVFDGSRGLYYHGRLDGSSPGNKVTCDGTDLRRALDDLLAGAPAPSPQHPSMGCNIKWK
jgi:peroxiredoxin